MTNPLVTPDLVEAFVGREMTSAERLRIGLELDATYAFLEGNLNRKLHPVDIVDEKHEIPGEWDHVYPFWGPVNHIDYVRFGSITSASIIDYNETLSQEEFPGQTIVYITYNAGDAVDAPHLATVKSVMIKAAMRALLQSTAAMTGITSYSVEGMSVSLKSDPDAKGPFTGDEWKEITSMGLKRIAIA